jgi:hypothetical protein
MCSDYRKSSKVDLSERLRWQGMLLHALNGAIHVSLRPVGQTELEKEKALSEAAIARRLSQRQISRKHK